MKIPAIPAFISKYLCGFDTFVRHRCVADLIKKFGPSAVLDVKLLAYFPIKCYFPV